MGVRALKCTSYFDLFSGASNLRSLRTTYLKCAEYVDILKQICKIHEGKGQWLYRVQKNGKETFLFPRRISAVCISLLCYSTMTNLPPSIVRDTGNNLLVQ